ncbi:MAG: tyrosine-type recombinase/integrase [Chloroflexota bacterium]
MNDLVHQANNKEPFLEQVEPLITTVLNTTKSKNTKIAYRTALSDFLAWFHESSFSDLNPAAINGYIQFLRDVDKSRSTINQRLSAIKKLAKQLSANGLIEPIVAWGISQIESEPIRGQNIGVWLTAAQAQALILLPIRRLEDPKGRIGSLRSLRDQAIIACFIGAGLRRSEVANLTFEHIQQRDGRWAIVNLEGKGGRIRSIGIPLFIYEAIERWAIAAGLNLESDEKIFKAIKKGKYGELAGSITAGGPKPYITDGGLTPQAVYKIIKFYAAHLGIDIAVHDLRRTAANLMLRSGADIRQIQQLRGHKSITTTERYLAPMISVENSAADFIHISLNL